MSNKGNLHHIAIDGQGYILKGSPDRPRRTMSRATVFGQRFAMGDRDYTDLSEWWYWAQTDWSGGFKDTKKWLDDAKYFWSTNIDATSKSGSLKLAKTLDSVNDFAENLLCGLEWNADGNMYVGTADGAANKPIVWKEGSPWTDISSATFATTRDNIWQILPHKGSLVVLTGGTNNTQAIMFWSGAAWTDKTAAAITAATNTIRDADCGIVIGSTLYVACSDTSNSDAYILSTADGGATFTELVHINDSNGKIIDMVEFQGDIYYLYYDSPNVQLRKYDISASSDVLVQKFNRANYVTSVGWGGEGIVR